MILTQWTMILALLVLVFLVFWAFLRQNWTTTLTIEFENWQWTMAIGLRFWRWSLYEKFSLPRTPANPGMPGRAFDPRQVEEGLFFYDVFRHMIRDITHRCLVEDFALIINLGVSDAAATARGIGAVSGVIGWWMAHRVGPITAGAPKFVVQPRWNQNLMQGEFRSIFKLRGTDIIHAALVGIIQAKRIKGAVLNG